MDDVWTRVVEQAERRLLEIETEREHLHGVIRHAKALSRGERAPDRKERSTPTVAKEKKRRPAPAMEPTRSAVQAILDEHGTPIQTRDLLPLVRDRGVDVGGKDPVATLSARLSNSEGFRNRRGVGWWFTDRKYPNEIEFEEAEDETVEGQPSASSGDNSDGGKSNAAALTPEPDR